MDNSTKQYDVVIVGGGWAGSILAYRLALANKKVLVLEAGIAIDGLITNPDENQLVTGNRAEFMNDFFMAMAKTPESPYLQNYNAPRPAVLDIQPIPPFTLDNPVQLPAGAPPPAPIDCADPKTSIDNGYFIQRG
ncbi:MAG: NAD(P)-binding protein, partial [Mucilaginibacter sp.]